MSCDAQRTGTQLIGRGNVRREWSGGEMFREADCLGEMRGKYWSEEKISIRMSHIGASLVQAATADRDSDDYVLILS